jgi:hypothetical protein
MSLVSSGNEYHAWIFDGPMACSVDLSLLKNVVVTVGENDTPFVFKGSLGLVVVSVGSSGLGFDTVEIFECNRDGLGRDMCIGLSAVVDEDRSGEMLLEGVLFSDLLLEDTCDCVRAVC